MNGLLARLALGTLLCAGLPACVRDGFDIEAAADDGGGPEPGPTPPLPDWTTDAADDIDINPNEDVTLNRCVGVVAGSGDALAVVPGGADLTGSYLLVVQMQAPFAQSGNAFPVTEAGGAGQWALTKVLTDDGFGNLVVSPPLAFEPMTDTPAGYTAQACTAPVYQSVNVDGTVNAEPWDGTSGGVIALLVARDLRVDGALEATGDGFRGGVVAPDYDGGTETGLDTPVGLGSGKGEGLDGTAWGLWGRGNYATGAGAGNSHNNGGGGGGNGGAGGLGGLHGSSSTDSIALAGSAQTLKSALVPGGGAGAGQQDDGGAGAGGNGGGIVFVISADRIRGSGIIVSDGTVGGDSDGDGAGGGGAGGTIWLDSVRNDFDGLISARGALGGNATSGSPHGTGGGGGGGVIVHRGAASPAATVDLAGGDNGLSNGASVGATPGATGLIVNP